jgi:mannose-6-phosphate isomerase-like protein (cupin superfamily)
MLLGLAVLAGPVFAQGASKPPPGACEAPAAEHRGQPGCYLTGELRVPAPPPELYWHILSFKSEAAAKKEAGRHDLAFLATSHGQVWLHVLGDETIKARGGKRMAVVGPIRRTSEKPHIARFLEADFTPGMKTRTHSHSGPEAFYVVSGEQCMETPTDRKMLKAGETYIVERGVHLQAAPKGRKNLVVVLHEEGAPWTTVHDDWTPTDFCNG